MSVGLHLKAVSEPGCLGAVAEWFNANQHELLPPSMEGDESKLLVTLHPAAEPVEFVVQESQLHVYARTASAGPGYHRFLCGQLKSLGLALKLDWTDGEPGAGDETGFFFAGDAAAVDREMLRWLRGVAEFGLERGVDSSAIAMPTDPWFSGRSGVLTPLGTRTRGWLVSVAEGNDAAARDFFSWWSDGLGAQTLLRLALVIIWSNVRWRVPDSEAEHDQLRYIDACLRAAWAADPSLQYPYREWLELRRLAGLHDELHDALAALAPTTGPLIGYRRGDMTVRIPGGWELVIPGAMALFLEDGVWSAFADGKTVWCFTFSGPEGQLPPRKPGSLGPGELHEFADAERVGAAAIRQEEDERGAVWLLDGEMGVPGSLVRCRIYFEDFTDKDWALATWRSLRKPPPPKESTSSYGPSSPPLRAS